MITYHESGHGPEGVHTLASPLKARFRHVAVNHESRPGLMGRVRDLNDSRKRVEPGFHHALNVRLARPGVQVATFADGITWRHSDYYATHHGSSRAFASFERALFHPALKNGTRLVPISPQAREDAEALGYSTLEPIAPSLDASYAKPGGHPNSGEGGILWVGSNHPRKHLTAQFEFLHGRSVTWIGPSIPSRDAIHHESQVMADARRFNVPIRRLTYASPEGVRLAYQQHQFLGVSSRHEGFCLPVWEAASQGCLPILLTRDAPSWYRLVWEQDFPTGIPDLTRGESAALAFRLAEKWQARFNTPESYGDAYGKVYRSLGYEN